MTALSGPLHLVALVLVVSGGQKLTTPGPAVQAMRSAGLPRLLPRDHAGRVLGAVEVTVGLSVLAVPEPAAAAALALLYLALAGFVVQLRRRDASASCGCFGSASAPPTIAHVVANLTGAAIGVAALVGGVPDIVDVFDEGVGVTVPYLALLAVGASLLLLGPALFGDLARLRRGPAPARAFAINDPGVDR